MLQTFYEGRCLDHPNPPHKENHLSPHLYMKSYYLHILRYALRGLLIALPLALLPACSDEEDPTPPPQQKCGRVVMVYMSMQNSLGNKGHHLNDSTEIAQAMAYIPENDRLLLFIDDAQAPRMYELERNLKAPKLVKRWTKDFSTASKEGLQEVLTLMRTQYAANEYALVVGSHATGWLPKPAETAVSSNRRNTDGTAAYSFPKRTVGIDVGEGGDMRYDKGANGTVPDQMEIADFASAVNAAGVYLRYILFDACLMQSVETAYALRKITDYIIASPISISAEGAYYTDLVRYGLYNASPDMVAITYLSYYKGQGSIPYYSENDGKYYGTVISSIRTDALPQLAATVRNILPSLANTTDGNATTWDMTEALNYHDYNYINYYRPHFYDLYSAFEAMGADKAQLKELRGAMDQAGTFYGANKKCWIGPSYFDFQTMPEAEEYCGVAAFIPLHLYTDNAANSAYGDLNTAFRHTEWYKEAGWDVTGW